MKGKYIVSHQILPNLLEKIIIELEFHHHIGIRCKNNSGIIIEVIINMNLNMDFHVLFFGRNAVGNYGPKE